MILDLCEKFHCLPSALLAEDTELLQLLRIEQLGRNRAQQERDAAEADTPSY